MDDPELTDWSEAVARACERAGQPLPDPITLGFMYDDGLEPAEAASADTQGRYCARPHRSFGGGFVDKIAERLTQPD